MKGYENASYANHSGRLLRRRIRCHRYLHPLFSFTYHRWNPCSDFGFGIPRIHSEEFVMLAGFEILLMVAFIAAITVIVPAILTHKGDEQ